MIESYLVGIGMSFFFAAIVAVLWVRGIDNMMKNHPDYKGEDFLNWGDETAPWETEKDEKTEK
mgnify:FL=1|jgi:hypothetical protein